MATTHAILAVTGDEVIANYSCMAKLKYKKTNVHLPNRQLALYLGAKIDAALVWISTAQS